MKKILFIMLISFVFAEDLILDVGLVKTNDGNQFQATDIISYNGLIDFNSGGKIYSMDCKKIDKILDATFNDYKYAFCTDSNNFSDEKFREGVRRASYFYMGTAVAMLALKYLEENPLTYSDLNKPYSDFKKDLDSRVRIEKTLSYIQIITFSIGTVSLYNATYYY